MDNPKRDRVLAADGTLFCSEDDPIAVAMVQREPADLRYVRPEDVTVEALEQSIVGYKEAHAAIASKRAEDAVKMREAGMDPSKFSINYEIVLAHMLRVDGERVGRRLRS